VLRQELAGALLALLDDAANLLVDHCRRGFGDVLALRHRMAEENLFLVLAIAQRPEFFGEAELGHHAAREVGRAANIVGCSGRDLLGPKISSSATRPPKRLVIIASSSMRDWLYLSRSGRNMVTPSARPRGMIVT